MNWMTRTFWSSEAIVSKWKERVSVIDNEKCEQSYWLRGRKLEVLQKECEGHDIPYEKKPATHQKVMET